MKYATLRNYITTFHIFGKQKIIRHTFHFLVIKLSVFWLYINIHLLIHYYWYLFNIYHYFICILCICRHILSYMIYIITTKWFTQLKITNFKYNKVISNYVSYLVYNVNLTTWSSIQIHLITLEKSTKTCLFCFADVCWCTYTFSSQKAYRRWKRKKIDKAHIIIATLSFYSIRLF